MSSASPPREQPALMVPGVGEDGAGVGAWMGAWLGRATGRTGVNAAPNLSRLGLRTATLLWSAERVRPEARCQTYPRCPAYRSAAHASC